MSIRVMDKSDLEFAAALTNEEGWYYTPREIDVMLRLDPEGSFIFEDGERMGFATCVTYGRTGVLGHLVVGKKGRGRKIGETLLKTAMEYMAGKGAKSFMLYSSKDGLRLYQKHGFLMRDEIYCAHLNLKDEHLHTSYPECVPMKRNDLKEAAEIDRRLFGDDRARLIEELHDEGPRHSFKIEKDGRIVGFVMAKHDHDGYDLGPWVCSTGNPKDAERLFLTELSTLAEGTVYMGSFVKNQAAVKIVDSFPVIRSWKIPMMIRGEERYTAHSDELFGIAAFELG